MKIKIIILSILLTLTFSGIQAQDKSSNTDWFMRAKYGLFVHLLPGENDFNKVINDFDVDGFAQDCQDAGAGYVFLTLGQSNGYYCSPNAVYNRWTGYAPGQKCSTRDLPMDLYTALAKKGIKLMLYLNGDVPVEDEHASKSLGASKRAYDRSNWEFNDTLVQRWAPVMQEWSDRYGDKVCGWWIDGLYSYNGFNKTYAQVFCDALKHGNPKSIVALNPGVGMKSISECQDFTAGESDDQFNFNTLDQVCKNRWTEGVQWHELGYLGKGWGSGEPRFTVAQMISHLKENVNANGGVFTFDVRLDKDFVGSRIHPSHLALLKEVKAAIRK